ncbi:hypothetical protein Taro_011039 [Colocasia esculenta]|uniref:Uncharacterized protein n=1 Tax=Colocasia esculenta TaxID=4460 RepID=A0A843U511_COLES|nr:hypothetical protein [Colocasia esculenta]
MQGHLGHLSVPKPHYSLLWLEGHQVRILKRSLMSLFQWQMEFPLRIKGQPYRMRVCHPWRFRQPLEKYRSFSAEASSSGPSSSRPNDPSIITPDSLIHPPAPPSFITLIPEVTQPEIHGIKDEFEDAILKSVLATGTHSHRTGISSLKELKFIRQYQMFCNYCYVNSLDEPQLRQFRAATTSLQSTHCEPLQVDFATLKFPDIVFLPPLHSLIMDSSVGTLIFERAARVMARLHVYEGRDLSFQRFVFKHYLEGQISAGILAPILSECERLTSDEWLKLYPLSAQQLSDLNASQAQENLPPLTPGDFLDANSHHLIRDSFAIWLERFKIFRDLTKELRSHQIFYPIKMDKFLLFASFGSFSSFKLALDLVVSRVLFPSVVKEDLVVSKVLFPSGVKEDLVLSRVLFPLSVKEDQLNWVL